MPNEVRPAGKNPDNFFYNICTDPNYGFGEFHATTMDNPMLPKPAIIHHGRLDKGVHLITKPFSLNDLAAKIRDVLDAPGSDLDGTKPS